MVPQPSACGAVWAKTKTWVLHNRLHSSVKKSLFMVEIKAILNF
jgi:hypothetical protein